VCEGFRSPISVATHLLSLVLPSGLNPGAANANREATELAMALDAFEAMLMAFGCPHALPTLNKTRADFLAQGGAGRRKKSATVGSISPIKGMTAESRSFSLDWISPKWWSGIGSFTQ
jgi:hypothetical protein